MIYNVNKLWSNAIIIPVSLLSILVSGNAQNPMLKTDMGFMASEGIYGEVEPGKSNTHEILFERAGQATISLNWKDVNLEIKITDPDGNTVDTSSSSNGYSANYSAMELFPKNFMGIYILSGDYPPGIWTIEISLAGTASRKTDYSIGLYYKKSELTIETYINKKRPRTSEPVILTTILQHNTTPVLDASVQATIKKLGEILETITLYDDGAHKDSLPNDGRYATVYKLPSVEGQYSAHIIIHKDGDDPIERIDYVSFITVENRSTIEGPINERVIDSNGDGLYDSLIITIGFNITQDSNYKIQARLKGAMKNKRHSYNNRRKLPPGAIDNMIYNAQMDTLLTSGLHNIDFRYDGENIFERGFDGPYEVESVALSEDSDKYNLVDYAEHVYMTKIYGVQEFQHAAIVYTGKQIISELDIDDDGLIDSLLYFFEVDLLNEGNYEWQGQLHEQENYRPIGFAMNGGFVKSGISTVKLSFSGSTILKSKIDGPYEVLAVTIHGENFSSPYNDMRLKTRNYKYTDFE